MSSGLGSAVVPAPPPGIPLGAAFWQGAGNGGCWDLVSVPGVQGDTIPGPVNALPGAGATAFTATTPPVISDVAIGGRRGAFATRSSAQFFINNAVAAVMNGTNKPFTVAWDERKVSTSEQIPWGAGESITGGTRNFVEVHNTEFSNVNEHSAANGTTTYAGGTNGGYDYNRWVLTWDGTIAKQYLNGVLDTLTPNVFDKTALVLDRFGWLAGISGNAAVSPWDGYVRRLYVSDGNVASAAQVAIIDAAWAADDYTLGYNNPLTPQYIMAGASVLRGSTDEINGMGYRFSVANAVINGRYSWASVGAFAAGSFANRNTPSVSGASAPQITTQVTSNLSSRTSLVIVDLGDEEIDLGQSAAAVEAAITTAIAAIRTAVYAVNPACRIAFMTICPFFEPALNTVCIAVNGALPGIWNASDAAFPSNPPLDRVDQNTLIGGPSYVQANFSAPGNDHPNNLGYTLIGTGIVAQIAAYLAARSPT